MQKLRETCEILTDKETMKGIQKSMEQIAEGKTIPLKELNEDKVGYCANCCGMVKVDTSKKETKGGDEK